MAKKILLIPLNNDMFMYGEKKLYIVHNISQLSKTETIFIKFGDILDEQQYRHQYETETNEQYDDYIFFLEKRIEEKSLYGMFYENSSSYKNFNI